jgi:hypothetical protein
VLDKDGLDQTLLILLIGGLFFCDGIGDDFAKIIILGIKKFSQVLTIAGVRDLNHCKILKNGNFFLRSLVSGVTIFFIGL